jgi:multimeric flavodoxin WrbA
MECLIMNGNPEPSGFDDYLEGFRRGLSEKGHVARRVDLRDLDISYCRGCWSCWWSTPGICVFKDGMAKLYPDMVKADLIVWASPLVMGTMSALMKKAQDRFIPLAHPYIVIHKGEFHHRHRYARNHDIGLIVGPGQADAPEDIDLARRFFERFSLNTRSRLRLFATTEKPIQEAVDEALAG